MNNGVHVSLPDQFDLVVGDTFQLFYRGVVEAPNPYCYDILATCEKGKNFPRYFEYTPDVTGQHELTIAVYSNDKTLLGEASTVLNVCQAETSPENETNILCVGDSLTAGGVWVGEVFRRLTSEVGEPEGLGLSNFRFIGTCKKEGVCFEGYGGWTWENYITCGQTVTSAVWIQCRHNKTERDQHSIWCDENNNLWQLETIEKDALKFNRYQQNLNPKPKTGTLSHYQNAQHTEPIIIEASAYAKNNPFWNESDGQVDLIHYCNENGFDKIDAVYIMLTWNGFTQENIHDVSAVVSQGKQFVDRIHEQYPHAKIKIMGLQVPSANGGTGENYGAVLPYCDDYGLTRLVFRLNRAYQAWANEENYKDFLEFSQISGQFDSEYNMPTAEKSVNTRSKKTEIIGTNGVHPATEGYLQIADAVYRNIVKEFTYTHRD